MRCLGLETFWRGEGNPVAVAYALGTIFLATAAKADGVKPQPAKAGFPMATMDNALSPDESITVIGHRPLRLAPLPDQNITPPPPTGLAPGNKLGPFVITGGPTDRPGSTGVAAGLAIPIKAVKGLEFGVQAIGSRDDLGPAGSRAGAGIVAGFKLKF